MNLTVLLISLGGAAFCTGLLYRDFHEKAAVGGHSPAGSLAEKDQNVTRKYGDNLLWEPLDVHDTLYWNDSVQTADHSMAGITLDDGNKIMLGESSLVVLEHDNESLSLFLKTGQLFVDSTRAKAKTAMIKVNGTAVEQKKGEKLSLQMDVQKHEVVAVHSMADGTAHGMMIDNQGHVEKMQLPAILDEPAPLARIYGENPTATVHFKWQTSKDAAPTFELARDRDFKQVVKKQVNVQQAYDMDLPPGMYYWRVSETGETRSFEVVQTTKPVLANLENSSVVFHKEPPVVEFSWQGNPAATKYVWQLSDTNDFKSIISSAETTATTFKTSNLKEGHLYWRVSAVYGDRSIASVPSAIDLKSLPEPVPAADLAPAKDFKINYGDYEKFHGIPFHWKTGPNETYRFVFSKSPDLKPEITGFETTQEGTLLKDNISEGTYYWSVGYRDDEGHWVYPEVRKLEIGSLVAPPKNEPAPASVAEVPSAPSPAPTKPPLDAPDFDMPGVQ